MSGLQISAEKVRELVSEFYRLVESIYEFGPDEDRGAAHPVYVARHRVCTRLRTLCELLALACDERGVSGANDIRDMGSAMLWGRKNVSDCSDYCWEPLRALMIRAGLQETGLADTLLRKRPDAEKGTRVTWQTARAKIERFTRAAGGVIPTYDKLALDIGCSSSTIKKAVDESVYLSARRAEAKAAMAREVPLTPGIEAAAAMDRDAAIERLKAEQEADDRRENRQAIAARRMGR